MYGEKQVFKLIADKYKKVYVGVKVARGRRHRIVKIKIIFDHYIGTR